MLLIEFICSVFRVPCHSTRTENASPSVTTPAVGLSRMIRGHPPGYVCVYPRLLIAGFTTAWEPPDQGWGYTLVGMLRRAVRFGAVQHATQRRARASDTVIKMLEANRHLGSAVLARQRGLLGVHGRVTSW